MGRLRRYLWYERLYEHVHREFLSVVVVTSLGVHVH
eukprot:SAG11_NODE_37769_length_255_cov_0.846154_1_plen_35_part_01